MGRKLQGACLTVNYALGGEKDKYHGLEFKFIR